MHTPPPVRQKADEYVDGLKTEWTEKHTTDDVVKGLPRNIIDTRRHGGGVGVQVRCRVSKVAI